MEAPSDTLGLFSKSSLKKIEKLMAKSAIRNDYGINTNSLKMSNKTILQIFLTISFDCDLNKSDQTALLEYLNALNEF